MQVYQLLRLRTYFTSGETETKAWTIREGMLAPQAAGASSRAQERHDERHERPPPPPRPRPPAAACCGCAAPPPRVIARTSWISWRIVRRLCLMRRLTSLSGESGA